MLAYVPVVFENYRLLPPRLWPVMQALVAHADRAGRCWPSVRRIADLTGVPKSSVSRYLTALAAAGHLSRTRKPGGVYVYTIAARWLPGVVSQGRRAGVPPSATEEKTPKKISAPRISHEDSAQWGARLRAWETRHYWNPFWGPRPGEAGCWAPQGS